MATPVSSALLARLPRTFVPALNEQIHRWDLLFPAERRTISAQMDWLARLPQADFHALFQPILAVEERMALSSRLNADRLSIVDTGILVRSPWYPQWRAETEKVFAAIDGSFRAEGRVTRRNRLVVCVMPAGVPARSGPVWPRLEKQGMWFPLETSFGDMLPGLFRAVAERSTAPDLEPVERTWALEYDAQLCATRLGGRTVALSFDELGPLRREFLIRLNAIDRNLQTVDRTYDELRRLDLGPSLEQRFGPEVSEFIRTLFLSGNGALLFGNSFVQWGASEALRRAAPQAAFCRFGIRPKLKPFSSVVLFEDQRRANPVADAPDLEGSFIDSRLLTEYVYLSAAREYDSPERLLALFAVPTEKRVLAVGPSAAVASMIACDPPVGGSQFAGAVLSWLATPAAKVT